MVNEMEGSKGGSGFRWLPSYNSDKLYVSHIV